MRAWLGRMPWAVGWLVCASLAWATPPATSAPPTSAPPTSALRADELRDLVRRLDADDFTVRDEAGRKLIAAGEAAIEPLSEVIVSQSPEAAWRATQALGQIALGGSDSALSRVVSRLQQLSQQGRPGLATVAKELSSKQASQRRDRAVAKIRSLGGRLTSALSEPPAAEIELIVGDLADAVAADAGEAQLDVEIADSEEIAESEASPADDDLEPAAEGDDEVPAPPSIAAPPGAELAPPPDLPPDDAAPPDAAFALPAIGEAFVGEAFLGEAIVPFALTDDARNEGDAVVLDKAWKGGDGGLLVLRELPALFSLSLHQAPLTDSALTHIAALPKLRSLDIESTPFTRQALTTFRLRRPEVQVFARGRALLGVIAQMSGRCVVTGVQAGSGASQAGLQAGDEIMSLAGQKVGDFSDLTIAVFSQQPGDSVEIEFDRDGTLHTVEVVLSERTPPPADG